jgi:hypothetical protein
MDQLANRRLEVVMRSILGLLIGGVLLTSMAGCTSLEVAVYSIRQEMREKSPTEKQKDLIYEHMKRYGINRDDVSALNHTLGNPHSYQYVMVRAIDLFKPGEHYRVEMDEFILTMIVPDAELNTSWIYPYTSTRQPDPKLKKMLEHEKGRLMLMDLGWNYTSPVFFGQSARASVSVRYNILENKNFLTPEEQKIHASETLKRRVPSQEKLKQDAWKDGLFRLDGTGIYLDAETVVINGRIWIRYAMNQRYGRIYRWYEYLTRLSSDRTLTVRFAMPFYDYNANPDPSTYPASVKKAFADMEKMVSSLRVAKVDDDGSPDPYVLEKTEPAPLPVREKLPIP